MKTQATQKQNQKTESALDAAQLIQKRAYERYLARGQTPGRELEDWLQAERDVRTREERQVTE